jgi:hypothetical protein
MSSDYSPIPGTAGYKAIQYLQSLAAGAAVPAQDLGQAIDVSPRIFASVLGRALEAGLLVKGKGNRHGKHIVTYSLGVHIDLRPEEREDDSDIPVRQSVVAASMCSSVFALGQHNEAAPFSSAITSDGRIVLERFGRAIAILSREEALAHVAWIDKNLSAFVPVRAEVAA